MSGDVQPSLADVSRDAAIAPQQEGGLFGNATTETLCDLWNAYKKEEQQGAISRIRVEQELVKRLGLPPSDKSKTHRVGNLKVEIKNPENVKVDWAKWAEVRGLIPEDQRPTKVIDSLDNSKFKFMRENNPEGYKAVCSAFTVSNGKPGFTITAVPTKEQ